AHSRCSMSPGIGAGHPAGDGHARNHENSDDILTQNAFRIKGRDPSAYWLYHNFDGRVCGAVSRYDANTIEPRKTYRPWRFNGDGHWHACAPAELPLYGLPAL